MTKDPVAIAEKLKQLLIESSPLIEEYTAAVCPDCAEVCCRQKHGMYQEGDIRYVQALGEDVPCRDATRPPDGPCEAMGPYGCGQPRWMRPFKCTWFFCEPLLAALNSSPPKKVRRLSTALQEMSDLYGELRG
jgi:hypothetical protein